jgi:hypothetical protein
MLKHVSCDMFCSYTVRRRPKPLETHSKRKWDRRLAGTLPRCCVTCTAPATWVGRQRNSNRSTLSTAKAKAWRARIASAKERPCIKRIHKRSVTASTRPVLPRLPLAKLMRLRLAISFETRPRTRKLRTCLCAPVGIPTAGWRLTVAIAPSASTTGLCRSSTRPGVACGFVRASGAHAHVAYRALASNAPDLRPRQW